MEFGDKYDFARVWINGSNEQILYNDYDESNENFFSNMDNVEVMLCSRPNIYSDSIQNYDIMNLVWFKGAEGLYNPTTAQGKFKLHYSSYFIGN